MRPTRSSCTCRIYAKPPAGVLFVSMLHFLTDADDPAAITGELRAPFPAVRHVALTHGDCYYYALVARKP